MENNIDIGYYNANPEEYQKLVENIHLEYGKIELPAEYSSFVHTDLLRLLIRLARYKFVARLIKKTDNILEIGCGSGLGSIFLSQHCKHLTGIDIKKSEIQDAISINKRKNVDFINVDFFNKEFSNKFDVIVCLDVIEHMPERIGNKLVNKISKLIKQTGMAVIGTPSIYSYEYQGELSKASHIKCYDQKELIEMIEMYFQRTLCFSMNDELVHTGYHKMAWYYFLLAFYPMTKVHYGEKYG